MDACISEAIVTRTHNIHFCRELEKNILKISFNISLVLYRLNYYTQMGRFTLKKLTIGKQKKIWISICCWYSFELPQQGLVRVIQMSTTKYALMMDLIIHVVH